jgi:hypothetical protein
MALFPKTDACSLLADPEGTAARRYSQYDAFLDHNHRALWLLAELGLLDRGDGLATLASIQRRTGELLEEMHGLLTSLRGQADGRYEALPGRVTGIHCYILDCGCVGLRQKFEDGSLNAEVELHHDPDHGPCAVCMAMKVPWENRIIDEVVVYNSMVRIG